MDSQSDAVMQDPSPSLIQLLTNPKILLTLVTLYIFAAAVNSLEAPTLLSSRKYRFFYKLVHSLFGQLKRAGIVRDMPRVPTGTIVTQSPFQKDKQ
jgi:hypothetical protein